MGAKAPDISGNSNLYLCEMENPWTLKGEPVMLSKPEYDWECRGFWVNEGPAVLFHGDKLFISYSASATDENYCMGLLWADLNADPQNPANWHKSPRPVFVTSYENRQYGRAITALRRRRKAKMCWSTTRETTLKLKAIRFTIPIAILA